jgi:predicted GTPase
MSSNEAVFNTRIEQPYGDETLRSFIDKLRANDIDSYIDLPEIAVMGDTSSGKSSLLSALTQIQLPSNDQITTRCPLRLRMEKSDKVKATLQLQRKHGLCNEGV